MAISEQVARYSGLVRVEEVLVSLAMAINSVPEDLIKRLQSAAPTISVAAAIREAETSQPPRSGLAVALAHQGLTGKVHFDEMVKSVEHHVRVALPIEVGEFIRKKLGDRPLVGMGGEGKPGLLSKDVLALVDELDASSALGRMPVEISKRMEAQINLEAAVRRSLMIHFEQTVLPGVLGGAPKDTAHLGFEGSIQVALETMADNVVVPLVVSQVEFLRVVNTRISSDVGRLQGALDLIAGIERSRVDAPRLGEKIRVLEGRVEELTVKAGKLEFRAVGRFAVVGLVLVLVVWLLQQSPMPEPTPEPLPEAGAADAGLVKDVHALRVVVDGMRENVESIPAVREDVKELHGEMAQTESHVMKVQEQLSEHLQASQEAP